MEALVDSPSTDLFARIPHGDGQTLLREALLVAEHNAGRRKEIVVVWRLLGAWPGGQRGRWTCPGGSGPGSEATHPSRAEFGILLLVYGSL